jgi:hypothetical protein
VDEVGAMQILQRLGNLIDDVFFVLLLEYVLPNNAVQVDLHVLEDKIDILVVLGSNDIVQFDYVLMIELLQKHDLTVGPLRIRRVLKGVEYFLQGQYGTCFLITNLPHMPVGPTPNLFL